MKMLKSLILLLLTWTRVVAEQMDVLIKVGFHYMPQTRTYSYIKHFANPFSTEFCFGGKWAISAQIGVANGVKTGTLSGVSSIYCPWRDMYTQH